MRTILLQFALAIGLALSAPAQEQPPVDTTRRELPRLEIPEITIVGKKAITLPFARKGELYNVPVHDAPPPDSSLIRERLSTGIPVPALPRYEERVKPWHVAVEGGGGSFGMLNLHGYADYSSKQWGMQVNGGFARTGGHADNSEGTRVAVQGGGYSVFPTDSDLLGSLKASFEMGIRGESFGMFGISGRAIERNRIGLGFGAGLSTAGTSGNSVKIGVGIRTWSVTDTEGGADSSVTGASPALDASVTLDAGRIKFLSELTYAGSSVSGDGASDSPSLLGFTAGARWRFTDEWFIQVGGIFASGSDAQHTSRTLAAPRILLSWQPDQDREVNIWWMPEITLTSYAERITENPYLIRSPGLPLEKKPVVAGSSFRFRSGAFAIEVRGSYAKINSMPLTVSRNGSISIEAADATSASLEASAGVTSGNSRVKVTGLFARTREEGGTVQAPMHPSVRLAATGELDLEVPVTLRSTMEFIGSQNTDRAGTESIGSAFLMSAGASVKALSRLSISFELRNLFGTSTEWWKSYTAPGREFRLQAYLGIM